VPFTFNKRANRRVATNLVIASLSRNFCAETIGKHTNVAYFLSNSLLRRSIDSHVDLSGAGKKVAASTGHAEIAVGPVGKMGTQITASERFAKVASAFGTPIDGRLGVAVFPAMRLTLNYPSKRLRPRRQGDRVKKDSPVRRGFW
jgi:hypothetical protein